MAERGPTGVNIEKNESQDEVGGQFMDIDSGKPTFKQNLHLVHRNQQLNKPEIPSQQKTSECDTITNKSQGTVAVFIPTPSNIRIITQPVSQQIQLGQDATFKCIAEADGEGKVAYQWLESGEEMIYENSFELKVKNVSTFENWYSCKASCISEPSTCVYSKSADLLPILSILYRPHEKVAILIANWQYNYWPVLDAPKNDIEILGRCLINMDFKVVSMVNLTKSETIALVTFCIRLINQNVYVVFYCVGHGFEENGMTHLVPVDSPPNCMVDNGICLNDILQLIQRKQPKLIAMILNVCREHLKHITDDSTVPRASSYTSSQHPQKANTILCFATGMGCQAFGPRGSSSCSNLIEVLTKIIEEPKGIDAMFSDVKKEFKSYNEELNLNGAMCDQIPVIVSSLAEPDRSLRDAVNRDLRGQDKDSANKIQEDYDKIFNLPQPLLFQIEDIGVRGKVAFKCGKGNVANVLWVKIGLKPEVEVIKYKCKIKFFASGKEMSLGNPIYNKETKSWECSLFNERIQTIRESLKLKVEVSYVDGRNNSRVYEVDDIDLPPPMAAQMNLWKTE